MSNEPNRNFQCPHCGGFIDCGENPATSTLICPHCSQSFEFVGQDSMPMEGEPLPSPGSSSPHPPEEQSRIVACVHCGNNLDVSAFDPLQVVTCCHCQQPFELLKQFGDFHLLKAYDAGWKNAFYFAKNSKTEGYSILKVLSAQALANAQAREDFLQRTEALSLCCGADLVSHSCFDEQNGFTYFAMNLTNAEVEERVLKLIGVNNSPQRPVQIEEPVNSRTAACPHCQAGFAVAGHNPMDEVTCSQCKKPFDLLRQFSDYRIDYRLAAGGTSILYLAQHQKSGRQVALKVLKAEEMEENPDSPKSFLREVELTQTLNHPNIIQVYEGGAFQGFYYMAQELVDGWTLNDILDHFQGMGLPEGDKEGSKKPLPELICLEFALQAAAGLGVAHQLNLVHGDVKPENMMITGGGVIKILDFGLVQFANTEKLFPEGQPVSIFGTPMYIPPERVRGEPEDFRSDFYALGATLYHLLRGIPPFRAKSPADLAVMHAEAPMLVFRAVAPWVSDVTCQLIEKSMKKSVSDRYASHLDFICDLTLARNLLLQSIGGKPRDGTKILKEFVQSLGIKKKRAGHWKGATTAALHTYRFITQAIKSPLNIRTRFKKN